MLIDFKMIKSQKTYKYYYYNFIIILHQIISKHYFEWLIYMYRLLLFMSIFIYKKGNKQHNSEKVHKYVNKNLCFDFKTVG